MDFVVNLNLESSANIELLRGNDINNSALPENSIFIPESSDQHPVESFSSVSGTYFIMGDPVYHEKKEAVHKILAVESNIGEFVRQVDGFYYIVFCSNDRSEIKISSSLFNIPAIFYSKTDKRMVISSSFDLVINYCDVPLETDDIYHLEKLVFNYPFLDRTPIKNIKRVNANTLLVVSKGKQDFIKHTDITQFFTDTPKPFKNSAKHLAESFINSAGSFLPDERSCITLTGGLDGRTIVSAGLAAKKEFYTYSYGGAKDKDILIPQKISKMTGVMHKTFVIDESFAKNRFWEEGKMFTKNSFGLGNISRAHYLYSAKNLFKNTDYLISGNFGSELIRSMKVIGVMTSEILFYIFQNPDKKQLINKIRTYPPVKYFNPELLNELIESLCESMSAYVKDLPKHLSDNQKFYVYLFEHVFPKYFGPEIRNQSAYIKHRAPFLSFRFIKELMKIEGLGANVDFRETNPVKRFNGQSLYGEIIKKCNTSLLNVELDKGYKPIYFVQPFGSLKIAWFYFLKKLKKTIGKSASDYQMFCLHEAISKFKEERIKSKYYDIEKLLRNYDQHTEREMIYNIISASVYLNMLEKEGIVSEK